MKFVFKLVLLILQILIAIEIVQAQDVIVFRDGQEIKAVVKEVGSTEIRYARFDNQTGPVYSIPKSQVFMIQYQNGSRDVFKEEALEESPVKTQQKEGQKVVISDRSIRKAKTASTVGYILALPILGLGIAASNAETAEEGIPLGAAATIIGGVGIPLVAGAARKTRNESGAEGNFGLRLAGWIAYGIALADAVYLLSLSSADVDTSGAAAPVAVAGSLSSVFMAIDAGATAKQSKEKMALLHRIQPHFGRATNPFGKPYQTIGITIRL